MPTNSGGETLRAERKCQIGRGHSRVSGKGRGYTRSYELRSRTVQTRNHNRLEHHFLGKKKDNVKSTTVRTGDRTAEEKNEKNHDENDMTDRQEQINTDGNENVGNEKKDGDKLMEDLDRKDIELVGKVDKGYMEAKMVGEDEQNWWTVPTKTTRTRQTTMQEETEIIPRHA